MMQTENRKTEYKPTTSLDEACPRCGNFDIRWGRPECTTVVRGQRCEIYTGRCRKCGRELRRLKYTDPATKRLLEVSVRCDDPVAMGCVKKTRLRGFLARFRRR